MSDETQDFLKSLGGEREWRFRKPCETIDFEYYDEAREVTVEEWEYLERRVLESNEKAGEEYRKEMTALPEPNHDTRNAVIVAVVSGLLLGAVFGGALLILMSRFDAVVN